MKKTIKIISCVFIITALSISLYAGTPEEIQKDDSALAPDFTLAQVDSDSLVTLSDFKDKKIVIVHFWKSR